VKFSRPAVCIRLTQRIGFAGIIRTRNFDCPLLRFHSGHDVTLAWVAPLKRQLADQLPEPVKQELLKFIPELPAWMEKPLRRIAGLR
jgi:hypothetical protein